MVVRTSERGDLHPRFRFRAEGHELSVVTAIGPDHISGRSATGVLYAGDYFTYLTNAGLFVLVFHDALADLWHLHR